jgi:hypothetical protein
MSSARLETLVRAQTLETVHLRADGRLQTAALDSAASEEKLVIAFGAATRG